MRILPLPIALLRLAAVVARLLALLWQPAAAVAGALRFVIYSTTHDSGGQGHETKVNCPLEMWWAVPGFLVCVSCCK